MTIPDVPPRPGPTPTPDTQPFWEATTRGELVLQRCDDCDRPILYPRSHCPGCWSTSLTWQVASGRGVLASHTTIHRPGHAAFADLAPYVVALVDLDEGVRLLANVDVVDRTTLAIGTRLELGWEDQGTYRLPRFRPSTPPPDAAAPDAPMPSTPSTPSPATPPPAPSPEDPR